MGMRPSLPPQPPPQMARQGTPKAVPVMVSAGLAIGVFCGLLFGVGTGDEEAKAATPEEKKFVGTKIEGTDEVAANTGAVGPAPPKSVTDGTLATGTMKEPKPAAGSGSAAGSAAAGSAAGTPTIPAPAIKMAKLVITIKPDSVKEPKITVDGVELKDNTLEIDLGDKTKKEVNVVVKADGFRDLEQKLEVNEGETNVEYQLVKKPSGGGTRPPRRPPPPGGRGGKKKGGGGLIDI
jgi:hypothetical protein